MDKQETAKLLEQINSFFPGRVVLSGSTVEAWQRVLASQKYSTVMRRLDKYVVHSKFPPTVHDLAERARPEFRRDALSEIEEWELMASGVPGEF
ncbi:replicative helicase loader/inhibitor [Evansella clarkii]|uniref:replicative helicase loader/inhibitor n=1 Tax=Evansella clarkii TaxID=79879 RepID=UPI000996B10D|nr:replicative helicase loader/inhibitor [Evansella clarkii]